MGYDAPYMHWMYLTSTAVDGKGTVAPVAPRDRDDVVLIQVPVFVAPTPTRAGVIIGSEGVGVEHEPTPAYLALGIVAKNEIGELVVDS